MRHPRLPSAKESVVLNILSDCREHYGLEILAESTGLLSRGGLYVILSRMEEKGYIRGRKEDVEPSEVARAPRRLYEITGQGQRALNSLQLVMSIPSLAVT